MLLEVLIGKEVKKIGVLFRENYNSVINLPTPTDIKGSRVASCDGSFACLR